MLRQNGASFRKKMFEDDTTFNFVQEKKSKNRREFGKISQSVLK